MRWREALRVNARLCGEGRASSGAGPLPLLTHRRVSASVPPRPNRLMPSDVAARELAGWRVPAARARPSPVGASGFAERARRRRSTWSPTVVFRIGPPVVAQAHRRGTSPAAVWHGPGSAPLERHVERWLADFVEARLGQAAPVALPRRSRGWRECAVVGSSETEAIARHVAGDGLWAADALMARHSRRWSLVDGQTPTCREVDESYAVVVDERLRGCRSG